MGKEDDGELRLYNPEPVERGRTARMKADILALLREQGDMTRDRLGELLLPELTPELARRYITPRCDELMGEGLVRETAFEALTRSGNRAKKLQAVAQ